MYRLVPCSLGKGVPYVLVKRAKRKRSKNAAPNVIADWLLTCADSFMQALVIGLWASLALLEGQLEGFSYYM